VKAYTDLKPIPKHPISVRSSFFRALVDGADTFDVFGAKLFTKVAHFEVVRPEVKSDGCRQYVISPLLKSILGVLKEFKNEVCPVAVAIRKVVLSPYG
jgi:hypothetical protein